MAFLFVSKCTIIIIITQKHVKNSFQLQSNIILHKDALEKTAID